MLLEATSDLGRHLAVGGLLIAGLVVIGGVVIPWLRRRFHPLAPPDVRAPAGGFGMERIEALRRAGELSDEEFHRLRRLALGLDAEGTKADNCTSSHPRKGDDDEGTARAEGVRADEDVAEE